MKFPTSEESRGGFRRDCRLGAADERGTLADFKTEIQARRHQRFRSASWRSRQAACQRGQKSEHQRRAAHRHLFHGNGHNLPQIATEFRAAKSRP